MRGQSWIVLVLLVVVALSPGRAAERGLVLKEDLSSRTFVLASDQSKIKGGFHEKYLFLDSEGDLWIFKPASDYVAYAEEAAWRLAARCGLRAAEVYSVSIKVNGDEVVTGSLGHILDDIKGGLEGKTPESLSPDQARQLQAAQVFRFLIGDFDNHAGNFLLDGDGRLVTIDHSLAFNDGSFFQYTLDSLAPFRAYSYFDTFFKAYRERKIRLDASAAFAFIEKVGRIPDKTIDAIVRPFGELKLKSQGHVLCDLNRQPVYTTVDQFVFGMLDRRRRLAEGFEKFYGRLAEARGDGALKITAVAAPANDGSEAVDAWPVNGAPLPIAFTDDSTTFQQATRSKSSRAVLLRRLATGGTQMYLRMASAFYARETLKLRHLLNEAMGGGLSVADLRELDLATVVLDDAFARQLRHSLPDVLAQYKERANFALQHPDASPAIQENARKLRLMVDQARAAQTNGGFGQNPAAP